jgi:hypothetical protein
MSHQLQIPMARTIIMLPRILPMMAAGHLPPLTVTPTPAPAVMTSRIVVATCACCETCLRCRRKTGKRPKTSMENSVREKTCVVDERRDASTVEAMSAAFVESEAGNLFTISSERDTTSIDIEHTLRRHHHHNQKKQR